MEREEIERVERELDAILKLVQPEPTMQDKAREEGHKGAGFRRRTPQRNIRGISHGRRHGMRVCLFRDDIRGNVRNMRSCPKKLPVKK